jgi:hypothetical protein
MGLKFQHMVCEKVLFATEKEKNMICTELCGK